MFSYGSRNILSNLQNSNVVINLEDKLLQYEKLTDKYFDSDYIYLRDKSIILMRRWNKIRKIIEYQRSVKYEQ